MKDISMIRIFRYALAVFIVLFFAAWSNPANAETGSLFIDVGVGSSYSGTITFPGGFTGDYTDFSFYNADYTGLSKIEMTPAGVTFSNSSNSDTFTITSGGTGYGTVSYSKSDGKITWYFFSTTITANQFSVAYVNNMLNIDISGESGGVFTGGGLNPNATAPLGICGFTCNAQILSGNYITQTRIQVTNEYNVTYNFTEDFNLFNVSIDKSMAGTTLTSVNISNVSGSFYSTQATRTNRSFHFVGEYNKGIVLNMSISSGYYDVVTVNTTDADIAETPNQPSENVVNGVGIVWEFDTYTIDTTGNLSWSKTTPALACDNIKIYDAIDVLRATISNPNDVGFYKIMLDIEGTWKAEYRRQTICALSVEEVINTAYTNVPSPEASYLVINATTIAGKQENVTYRSGRIGPFAPYLAVLDSEGQPEGKFSISGYSINVEGTSSVVITTSGQHTIRICDAFGCDPAIALTNTVFNTSIPTMNITQSNITMDNTLYSFEDTAIITYAIDNFNFSNKAIIITSYNWNYGIEQTRFVGFSNQTGSVQELLSLFLGKYVYTGLYSMRLVGRNDSGDFILAFWNFSISDVDTEGYMLKMSKNKLCIGEINTFVVQSPTTSYMNITLNTNGNIFNSYSINMNKTISYKPSSIGTYSVILYSPEGYVKRSYTFDVDSCVTPTPTPGPTQGAQQAKAMANMLMSNIFWSFIITAGLMIAMAWKTKHGMATVAIGALSMTVFASIGWFPLWAFFSIVIICATLLAANWVRQQFDIGTSGD